MDQNYSKSQHYMDFYNYQKNLIAHTFLLHQVFLERDKVIQQIF